MTGTHMTTFYFNYLLKTLPAHTVTSRGPGVRTSTGRLGEDTVQPLVGVIIPMLQMRMLTHRDGVISQNYLASELNWLPNLVPLFQSCTKASRWCFILWGYLSPRPWVLGPHLFQKGGSQYCQSFIKLFPCPSNRGQSTSAGILCLRSGQWNVDEQDIIYYTLWK